ncbi:shikimate kinase [Anoxybacillus vitaminiphilus]|jgi:shikimate kinase|uniref:Shikimate kinase n=1 Tax=Paranoxybacillus vitaminiphilus TaxID=581036 RepID=A0A327YQ58_9BACL|nr:shikimate kinase [Anoxybacillus vitaminiphilus]RAK22367.1 shikimate kinase [Anoxybacillus vitaminiphilus]
MKAIFLTGFMGAGKTSVGRQLAERLGVSVVDTDEMIEQKVGKSISEIFASEGESAFRKYERELLKTLPLQNIVVTTGGGMVIQKENRDWMKKHGIVIYLHCEPEEILRRLAGDETRPLLKQHNKQELIKRLLTERMPYYQEAHFIVNTTHRTMAEVVDDIVAALKQHM